MHTHTDTNRETDCVSLLVTFFSEMEGRDRNGDVRGSILVFVIILQMGRTGVTRLGVTQQTPIQLTLAAVYMMYIHMKDRFLLDIWKSGYADSLCHKHVCCYLNHLLK